jgi:crotonobetainyl-CoA:carnitine CoA-transferase CaiB-like acyl-CoA transferase
VAGLLADDAREPGKAPTLPIGDMSSAVFAAYSVVCALFSRERTGAGTYIDVSVSDCLVSLISPLLVPAMNGAPTLSFLKSPAYGMFACADGKTLTLSIAHEDHFWKILCEALDLDNFSDLTHSERVHESEKLRSIIARIISREPLSKWSDMFVGKGIPWGPINTLEDVANDPHFKSRGVYELIENADGVSEFHVRQPVKFSAYPERALTRPPGLGEHNREIFRNTNEK